MGWAEKIEHFVSDRIGGKYYFLLSSVIVLCAFFVIVDDQLNQLSVRSDNHINQTADRLDGQLGAYKLLTNSVSRHPNIVAAVQGNQVADLNELLLSNTLISGARLISLRSIEGNLIAISEGLQTHQPTPKAFSSAGLGNLEKEVGRHDDGTRFFAYTKAVFDRPGTPLGFVTVELDLAALEFEWTIDDSTVLFVAEDGQVLISDRPEFVGAQFTEEFELENKVGSVRKFSLLGNDYWLAGISSSLNQLSLIKRAGSASLNLTVVSAQNAWPSIERALFQALLLTALLALIGVVLKIGSVRREGLRSRLSVESELNQALEARVTARTQELENAQKQLVFAGKLSAMGQLSATITHELNQPLAATRNFAENGSKFIDKGRFDDAKENMLLITNQLDRISRIIKNLRAFAGREEVAVRAVDVMPIISESINLLSARLRSSDVDVRLIDPPPSMVVVAGEIRLQQVFVNLVLNAIDAMQEQVGEKLVEVHLLRQGEFGIMQVRDNGPGLEKPAQVFEPFYSTKHAAQKGEGGKSGEAGLGLGLSISRDIIGSFGGTIECQNAPSGGAIFTVKLKLAATDNLGEKRDG